MFPVLREKHPYIPILFWGIITSFRSYYKILTWHLTWKVCDESNIFKIVKENIFTCEKEYKTRTERQKFYIIKDFYFHFKVNNLVSNKKVNVIQGDTKCSIFSIEFELRILISERSNSKISSQWMNKKWKIKMKNVVN